jgi:hypothetical protein
MIALINEQTTDVASSGFVGVGTQYTPPSEGVCDIKVVVDEDDLKIETDDSNNEDSKLVTFVATRGDANGDGIINSVDVLYLINYLFVGGPMPQPWEAGDCNCDGVINAVDVLYLINHLYAGGPPPGC